MIEIALVKPNRAGGVSPLSSSRGRPNPVGRVAVLAVWLPLLAGCQFDDDDPHRLVIATPWPIEARAACAAVFALDSGHGPITWVELGSHRWLDACDRRGGVDLILGGPAHSMQDLADHDRLIPIKPDDPVPWRQIQRPGAPELIPPGLDPRDDPATLAEAQRVLASAGWTKGYEALARRPIGHPFAPAEPITLANPARLEAVALVRGGRHPDQAARFLAALTDQGWITPAQPDADEAARTDNLLADLLGAALIDARNERRDAQMALEAHGHPTIAEEAVGQLPPWPPASVARLRDQPARVALADALVEQVAPNPLARFWLAESWHQPDRRVNLDLLHQISGAEGGRLVREPRFRAWLRGEWTAWTQQLYRRVARLAGGYRPS